MTRWFAAIAVTCLCLAACTGGDRRYSSDPVEALRLTSEYLKEDPSYTSDDALSSLSVGRISLGRKLFFDRRLSPDGRFACASCHDPDDAYTENDRAVPAGAGAGGRNAPSLLDVVNRSVLFHDGRASLLEKQVMEPLLDRREMGNQSMDVLAARIRSMPDYDRFFAYAFNDVASPEHIAAALSAYQRTLITGPNDFDLWRYGGKPNRLTTRQVDGYNLFVGKARCATCHLIGQRSASFTDEKFHDTGYSATRPGAGSKSDTGRFAVTGNEQDRFAFRTPTLRNVALTGPYMHDGGLKTLDEVVDFFDTSGNLGLRADEKADLVDFLETLTSRERP